MRIVHFELPADDPAWCMAFYQRAFVIKAVTVGRTRAGCDTLAA